MSGGKNQAVVEAAAHLLGNRHRHKTEGNVQSHVEALLRATRVGTIESHYQLGSDQADIYLPNRRAFIECKAYPKAAAPEKPQGRKTLESPREQLDRYVRAEIKNELSMLPGLSSAEDSDWIGIVTDGTNWHVYRYPHEAGAGGSLESSEVFINEADLLATFLCDTLGAEMVGKEWIPEKPGELFSDLKDDLDSLYRHLPRKAIPPTRTKQKLWLDMMQTSGMVPADDAGQERLFLAHSFLIVVARLVSQTLNGRRDEPWTPALRDGFASWVLDFDRGQKWAGRVWNRVDGYDWRRRRGDVLRDLYHRYVSEQDRKVFGEYYTPDWLAALMVEEVLDEQWIKGAVRAALDGDVDGIGVLDPACGSGTFLYHAALRILASPSVDGLRPGKQANVVAKLVNGMDIHPVAVEIARVNIERALPGEPTDGASALRIFLGDSLQTAARGELLFGRTKDAMRLITPSGREASIPMGLVQSPSFAESMRRMVNAAAQGEPLPDGIASEDDRETLESCHRELTGIIEAEGNSVWTWYAVNLAGPYLLANRKIDRIVANPPWVKLSDIQVEERKRTMEDFGKSLGLQAGGKQAPHLDIASFFILRARELYVADPSRDPGSWLVKKSAIQSGQWELFRQRHMSTLAQSVDLQDLNPFHGGDATRCCLLMEHRPLRGASATRIHARRTTRRKLETHESLASARRKIEFVESPDPIPQRPSNYLGTSIRQGATILPHVLTLIGTKRNTGQRGWVHVETQRSSKKEWAAIPCQSGSIPEAWIREIHMARYFLPYVADRVRPEAIIPVARNGGLHPDPGRECQFWRELDEIYDVHRGRGTDTPETLMEQFDFSGKLSAQPLRPARNRRMVLYSASGDIMRAARSRAGTAVVDKGLYWLIVSNDAEAGYLVALLNAACLRRAFAESRNSGRHFDLNPWRRVPIPRYNPEKAEHRRLAQLCTSAEKIVQKRTTAELERSPELGQRGLSTAIRESISNSKVGREIERIAAQLMPDQAN